MLYNDNTRRLTERGFLLWERGIRGFPTNSGTMGGVEKARQRGIPRYLLSNLIFRTFFRRLKEAPMEERELEIVDLGGKETSEERVRRIKETSVTLNQFVQCIDFQMLRFFASLLLFMIAGVVVVTFFYLLIIYTFKFAMWEFYFPKQPFDQMKTEL